MPSKELIAASTVPVILTILAKGESYGYQLIKEVAEQSGGELEWSEAMLYPVLQRLESNKLIQSRWVEGESGKMRKYYRITRKGGTVLEDKKAEWLALHAFMTRIWKTT
ncbi:MAG: PadR family transcriptional regulator [Cyclobacteriaceae bacterium]|nr:PadR family transcriptional regulator [Cyclobacteriaceae bacterium]